jgi:hypothetical protein
MGRNPYAEDSDLVALPWPSSEKVGGAHGRHGWSMGDLGLIFLQLLTRIVIPLCLQKGSGS